MASSPARGVASHDERPGPPGNPDTAGDGREAPGEAGQQAGDEGQDTRYDNLGADMIARAGLSGAVSKETEARVSDLVRRLLAEHGHDVPAASPAVGLDTHGRSGCLLYTSPSPRDS